LCCSVLQCVAVSCRLWQTVAVCCSGLMTSSVSKRNPYHTRMPDARCSFVVCCSVLQCLVVRSSVLQCVAACCSVLQRVIDLASLKVVILTVLECMGYVAVSCGVLQRVAACCRPRQSQSRNPNCTRVSGVRCSGLWCVAACCSVLQRVEDLASLKIVILAVLECLRFRLVEGRIRQEYLFARCCSELQ